MAQQRREVVGFGFRTMRRPCGRASGTSSRTSRASAAVGGAERVQGQQVVGGCAGGPAAGPRRRHRRRSAFMSRSARQASASPARLSRSTRPVDASGGQHEHVERTSPTASASRSTSAADEQSAATARARPGPCCSSWAAASRTTPARRPRAQPRLRRARTRRRSPGPCRFHRRSPPRAVAGRPGSSRAPFPVQGVHLDGIVLYIGGTCSDLFRPLASTLTR